MVKKMRGILGQTQAELAAVLCVSPKAVQSYEQGWRRVPRRVMIQLLVLLAIHRRPNLKETPCWKITGCPEQKRKRCPSFTIAGGRFCWFVAPTVCKPGSTAKGDIPCLQCPVIGRLLAA
jgi:DNA-binding XRE family transcriptional regulator